MKLAYPLVGFRRVLCCSSAFLGLLLAGLPAHAATIVPDVWYVAGSSAGTPVAEDGLKFATNQNTTSSGTPPAPSPGVQHMLTYFDSTSLLDVGDSVSLSLTFSGENVANNTGYLIGFAFYNSGGSRISANGLGQGNAAFDAYRGYRVGLRTQSGSSSPFELRARSANNIVLANTGTAHATVIASSDVPASNTLESKTLYNLSYSITRTAADSLGIAFEITGGTLSGYSGTWTVAASDSAFHTTFDTFAISLGNGITMSALTLYDVSITTSSIPEPATAAAWLGLGALGLVACLRRRR